MPDEPTTTQATAESTAPPADRAPAPATTTPDERPQLASFEEALTRAAAEKPSAATATGSRQREPKDSDPRGSTARAVSKPDGSTPSPDAPPEPTDDEGHGHAAAEALTPGTEEPKADGKDGPGEPDEGSRRGRATIKSLTSERDALRQEVESLRATVAVPDHIMQAAVGSRLTDDEFNALRDKKQREDLTGEYLTLDESDKLSRAIQIRDWSLPWYQDAETRAAAWAEQQRQAIMQSAANDLAPVLKGRDYLSPEAVGRADSWRAIYDHLCDASHEAGRKAGLAELQPKLDEANGRVHDLEAELSGLRPALVGRGRSFERGGTSGGAYSARPNLRSAGSAGELFAAAEDEAAQRRARRAVGAR